MAKTKNKRTVSDLDAQSIESFLNGGSSSYDYDSYSSESYIDPVLGQEAINILSDIDTDHGTALMHTMEALNEANMIAQSIENYIGIRNLKIKMCNAFSRTAKAKGYGIEAIDFWRSMESDDDEDKKKDKNDDKWYKNAWEAIKAFFKKIILAVINFIKTIGNFLKGALCKAQDLFYKKYAKDISNNYQKYIDESGNADLKIKMKAASEHELWKVAPWELLKDTSVKLVSAFSVIHQSMVKIGNGSLDTNEVMKAVQIFEASMHHMDNSGLVKKMKDQAGKWFPSAASVVNEAIYGKEKPSKTEIRLIDVFKNKSNIEILSPAALTSMTYAFKTAQQANKNLTNCLKYADKMSKQSDKFEKDNSKKNKSSIDKVNDVKRMSQFATTLLIQLYGECLSCRMKVFSAAKKLYKKGEYKDDDK